MASAKKKAAAVAPASTIRVKLSPKQLEQRRVELGEVRARIAQNIRVFDELAAAVRRTKAKQAENLARAERLVDCLVTGEEDQPAQLELAADASAPRAVASLPPVPRTEAEAIAVIGQATSEDSLHRAWDQQVRHAVLSDVEMDRVRTRFADRMEAVRGPMTIGQPASTTKRWQVLRLTQTLDAPSSELERLNGLVTETAFEGDEHEAREVYEAEVDAAKRAGNASMVLYDPRGRIADQYTPPSPAAARPLSGRSKKKVSTSDRNAPESHDKANGAVVGPEGPAVEASTAPPGPLTISLREADLNELIRDPARADVLCWDAAETEITWSPDGRDDEGRDVVESDPADGEQLERMRGVLAAAGVGWSESIPAGDVVRTVPARGWVTPPPDERERPAGVDPLDLVRESGQKHVIVERAFGSWRRAHHGPVKGEAQAAWRRVKTAARNLWRDARWYENGVVVQRFDPGDLKNARRAGASP